MKRNEFFLAPKANKKTRTVEPVVETKEPDVSNINLNVLQTLEVTAQIQSCDEAADQPSFPNSALISCPVFPPIPELSAAEKEDSKLVISTQESAPKNLRVADLLNLLPTSIYLKENPNSLWSWPINSNNQTEVVDLTDKQDKQEQSKVIEDLLNAPSGRSLK